MTFRELLDELSQEIPQHEAEQLCLEALLDLKDERLSRSEFLLRSNDLVDERVLDRVSKQAKQVQSGEPLQYVTGRAYFLDHTYRVDSRVLIPRPETEVLVTTAISELAISKRSRKDEPLRGFEIGIGSGIISIELLAALEGVEILAVDVSKDAIALALENASEILNAEQRSRLSVQVNDRSSQVLENAVPPLDFVVSNPPYIARGKDWIAESVARFEPEVALYGPDEDPLYFYRKIAQEGRTVLRSGGQVFLEMASERWQEIEALFRFEDWSTRVIKDLAGRHRVLVATRKD